MITLVNELVWSIYLDSPLTKSYYHSKSRLAVNAVTLGNFDEPIRISVFVKDLFAGFSMVSQERLLCSLTRVSFSATAQLEE